MPPEHGRAFALCHQHAQEGGSGFEDGHSVARDGGGEAVGRRDWRALEENRRHVAEQRRGNHVRLAGDPSGRGDDEEDVGRRLWGKDGLRGEA